MSRNFRAYAPGWKSLATLVRSTRSVAPFATLACGIAGLCNDNAYAADAEAASTELTEIVVTAERRESTVQKTAISITAITGAQLGERGQFNLNDVIADVPGVASLSDGPGQAQYEIRGMSSGFGGVAATVGFYLDDVSVAPPTGNTNGRVVIDPNLYDLQRVEVLRGPQGTLYGAGSMGGTIKLITNTPDLSRAHGSAETILSGTEGGGFNYGANAMFNAPLIDDVAALRVVVTGSHRSGWIDRVVIAEPDFPASNGTVRGNVAAAPVARIYTDANDANFTGGRASLLVQPVENLTLTPSVLYQKITQGGMDIYDSPPGNQAIYQAFDIPWPFADTVQLYSLPVKYTIGSVQVTSSTGYWSRASTSNQDSSAATAAIFGFPTVYATGGQGVGAVSPYEKDSTHQFSQELRLASNSNAPLQWLAGLYYEHYKSKVNSTVTAPGFLTNTFYGAGAFPTNVFSEYGATTDVVQKSAFANVSYELTDKLKLTAGLRYYSYDSNSNLSLAGIGSSSGGFGPPVTSNEAATNHGVNPMGTVSYSPTQDVMFYGTIAKGFRDGSTNAPVPTTGPTGDGCLAALQELGLTQVPGSYQPDTVVSYELGQKALLLDHRMTLNADVYLLKWSKVQESVVLGDGCGYPYTANSGDATVKGSEAELAFRATPALTVTQTVGYTHSIYTNSSPGAGIQTGDPVPQVPHWTVSTALDYTWYVGAKDSTIVARLSNSYVSKAKDRLGTTLNTDARDLADFRLGWRTPRYTASLFVNNIANRHYNLGSQTNGVIQAPDVTQLATNQPRTIGVDLSANF